MSVKIGLVGLPNVGKSSLFNFFTKKETLIANYPFATIDPSVGIMLFSDPRLARQSDYWKSKKTTPSVIEIVDIAGLVKGASQGSGLGNEFLSHIREVDLICHVLRCFPEKEIVHVEKSIDPIRDFEIIQLELILADLQQVTKKLNKIKVHNEKTKKEESTLKVIQTNLENGQLVKQIELSEEERDLLKGYNFLTNKPIILIGNYGDDISETNELKKYTEEKKIPFFPLAVKLEKETEDLSPEEKKELGWNNTDFSLLADKIKQALELKTFFTTGEDETKSWLAKISMNAKECAGLIHSDIEKGFIRVEVYNYNDWLQFPSREELKKSGKIRKEGAEYLIQEGDVCYFLFSK
ncbi:MAG: Ribosome-binding ATPase YchF [Mycoplasmataceae bacterium]|nr:MAG: Ribosome-binding ATPase YchF [Mycoplasmataceae bacterium]